MQWYFWYQESLCDLIKAGVKNSERYAPISNDSYFPQMSPKETIRLVQVPNWQDEAQSDGLKDANVQQTAFYTSKYQRNSYGLE